MLRLTRRPDFPPGGTRPGTWKVAGHPLIVGRGKGGWVVYVLYATDPQQAGVYRRWLRQHGFGVGMPWPQSKVSPHTVFERRRDALAALDAAMAQQPPTAARP